MLARMFRAWRAAYSGLSRESWALAGVTLVNRAGSMVLPFLALYLTRNRGLDVWDAGLLQSCYGVGALPGSYLGGWLSGRGDAKRVLFASLSLGGLGFLVIGAVEGTVALGAVLFAQGLFYEMTRPASVVILARVTPPAGRLQAMALHRLAVNLGAACGGLLGGFLAARDYALLFWVDGLTSLAAAAALVFLLRPLRAPDAGPAPGGAPAPGSGGPFRDPVYLAFLGLTLLLATLFFQADSTAPQYFTAIYGFDEETIGILYFVNTAIIVALEMVLVHRLRGRPALHVAAAGALLVGGGFALIPFGAGFAWAATVWVILTLGEMLTGPFCSGFMATRGSERHRGGYSGAYMFTWAVAYAIAPFAGTRLWKAFGPDAPWHACAVLAVLLPVGFLIVSRKSASRITVSHAPANAPGTVP